MLDRVIAALESKQQKQSISDERFIREQRILEELAPIRWRGFRQVLEAKCKANPKYLIFEIHPWQCAVVRCANGRVLEVEYLAEAKTIVFQSVETSGECGIGLDARGRAAILDADGKILTSEVLADELLTMALQRI
jgi:hypothetical protein